MTREELIKALQELKLKMLVADMTDAELMARYLLAKIELQDSLIKELMQEAA